jgi:hypothetical protein
MTIRQRVTKLEADGRGVGFDLVEALEEGRDERRALLKRVYALSNTQLVAFAFDAQGDTEERETALNRMIEAGVEIRRAKAALGEFVRAESEQLREQAKNTFGRSRELLLRMARAVEHAHFIRKY